MDYGSSATVNPKSMEWHFGSYIDDLAVPKIEEMFNRFPSPGIWSSWGQRVGNFDYPEKVSSSVGEDFLHFCCDAEELVAPHVDQDAGHAFNQWKSCTLDDLDPQLNDIAMINEADDIFVHSLFEDATDIDGAETSPQFSYASSNENMISARPSGEWNHIQNCAVTAANVGSPRAKFKEPEFDISLAEEDSSECDMSMEESVFMELRRSTLQLTEKTRLCFRDSLYRLAEDSRHHTKSGQNGREAAKNSKTTSKRSLSRSRQSKPKTQGTNAIDTTVANMLFNAPALPLASCLIEQTLEQETHWDKSDIFQRDAEVPTFGPANDTPQERHYICLSTAYPTHA